jgi:arylsulfatase A-like enzyme
MSAYGCDWVETPGFDRVAEEGLLFTRAYTPNAKCAPSRASVLTGRNSWQLEEAANHWCYFPAKFRVYTEVLAEHGYHVGSTGKGWAPGIAETEDGEPRHLAGPPYHGNRTRPPAKHISNKDYAANFEDFLDDRSGDEPFCFWYGAHEPHRRYEHKAGVQKGGKELSEIDRVPDIWPDRETVRHDMLDYAFEIERFDAHLLRMLNELEARGELENTLVIVTADNGMPFPRVKGQKFEHSNHMPLAIMWPAGIENPGRVIEDYVSFIDFAPTFVEVAGLDWSETGMHATPGRSLTDIFESEKAGRVNPERDHVLIGKERHDIGRPEDRGYPVRGIVADDVLYLKNFEPDRWPAGHAETGYLNCDASPTKTLILENRTAPGMGRFWELSFGKRPTEQLYRLRRDPHCINNLAEAPRYAGLKERLRKRLFEKLEEQGDPRMHGNGEVFDNYPYANESDRNFYERFMAGELDRGAAGWVNPSDFEDEPLD